MSANEHDGNAPDVLFLRPAAAGRAAQRAADELSTARPDRRRLAH